jgi:replicative DNA helicase
MTDIEVELRKFVRTNGLDIVVIDYLGLIKDDSGLSRKRHEQIQEFSMRIKSLAKDLNIPIVVLVQLTRDSHNKRLDMSCLAESAQIERDADMIYLLYTPEKDDPTKRILIGDKGRAVGKADLPLYFSTQTTEFTSMSEREEESYINSLNSKSNGNDQPQEYF